MKTKEKAVQKDFDAVKFMRKQRDKISKDIADMSFLMTRPFNISSSNFPYETKMLDDWFRKQVKNQQFLVK